ncbi:MAG: HAMP domain-containing sensor histidine kinase [Melioribacteraceae bacterium]
MDENNLKSLRVLAAIGIIVGVWSLLFEIYFFQNFLIEIYFARVSFTGIALTIFIISYRTAILQKSNLLIHLFIISLISSFVYTIYKIPATVYINSQILSLLIFTTAIIFSWETRNQIIVAIYYNLFFAASIMYNDSNIYLLPNILSLVIFVCLISFLSVAASFINYNLRKKYLHRTEEINFLFNSVPVGICSTDIDGKILTSNKYLNNLLKCDNSSVSNNILKIIHDNSFKEFFQNILSDGNDLEQCVVSYNNSNSQKYLRITAIITLNRVSGKAIEFIIIDETKEIKAANELKEASAKLLKETQEKEKIALSALLEKNKKIELLAKINHEVRTPLNSILLYFEMLEEGVLKSFDDAVKYSRSVKTSSQSLLNTINNFIDYAKIETGKMDVENELFVIKDELENIVQLLSPLASSKKIDLEIILKDSSVKFVFTDLIKYRQILTNLIANAIKFTKIGSVKIIVENQQISRDEYYFTTSVRDTGPGIPKDKLASIFDPFVSLNSGHEVNYSSGLGLTICTEFVRILNGEINVESTQGEGTTFTVKIPYKYDNPKYISE